MTEQCGRCKHYKAMLECDAFPEGIPEAILTGRFDHTKSFEGEDVFYEPSEQAVKNLIKALDSLFADVLEKGAVAASHPMYVGPKGGKWADVKHTVHWEPLANGHMIMRFPKKATPVVAQAESHPTKSTAFKAWFGDWEGGDKAGVSKVVKKDGSPAEEVSIQPVVAYHGTAHGGFTKFDKSKVGSENIYGPGFYFTEDKEIATEYMEKDEDKVEEASTGIEIGGKPVEYIPKELAQWVLDNTYGWGTEKNKKSAYGYGDSFLFDNPNYDNTIANGIENYMTGDGVPVAGLLAWLRNPSGVLKDKYGKIIDPKDDSWEAKHAVHSGGKVIAHLLDNLREKDKSVKGITPEAQLFEVYLNVKNPLIMHKVISREEFKKFAIGVSYKHLQQDLARRLSKESFPIKDWSTEADKKDSLAMEETAKRAKEMLTKLPPEEEFQADPELFLSIIQHVVHPDDHRRFHAEANAKRLSQGCLGGAYLDDVMSHAEREAVGSLWENAGNDEEALSYDQFLHIKNLRRKDKALLKDADGNNVMKMVGGKKQLVFTDEPAHGVLFQGGDEKNLTWGDVQWIHSNAQQQRVHEDVNEWARTHGYDGIQHIGGWNIGTKSHLVWVAFEPNQIKSTKSAGFSTTDDDIMKSEAGNASNG